MSHHNQAVVYMAERTVVISNDLQQRILEAYNSDVLALQLAEGNEQAIYVLSQLVHMNFNADRILLLSQEGDVKAITRICKEHLEGMTLLNELHRVFFEETLH